MSRTKTEPLKTYRTSDPVERAILEVAWQHAPTRELLFSYLYGVASQKVISAALRRLREIGAVYRTSDGYYQTDISPDNLIYDGPSI